MKEAVCLLLGELPAVGFDFSTIHSRFMSQIIVIKKYIFLFSLLLSLCFLMHCKKDDDILKSNPPPQQEPDTLTTGAEISAERRVEIFESVNLYLNELSWSDRAGTHSAIVDHLKKYPEFDKVEYDETADNIIARFTDGAIYMMVNNRNTENDIPEPDYSNLRTSSNQKTTAYEYPAIPSSSNVYIFKGVGNYFKSSSVGSTFYKFLFDYEKEKTGYTTKILDATIENLKTIKDAGVFYYCSHGGMGRFKDNPKDTIYGSWTTEKVTVDSEKKYRKEINKRELVYMDAYDRHENGKTIAETHFAITSRFVDKYMDFPKNSLIYLDLCQSFRVKDFWWSFHSKSQGTATVAGWSDNVGDDDAHKAISFVFDRLLGVNIQGYSTVIPEEKPKQRSFDFPSVYNDMIKRDLVKSIPYQSRPYQVAFLKYQSGPNKDIVLRPSISYMQVYEYFDWLFIYGLFGEDPGASKRSVTIDGEATEVLEWTPVMVKCKIKSSGKGSAGDVIVKVKDNESRPRILTEWRGELTYKRPSAGSYMEEVTIQIHLRRDVAGYRKGAGHSPEKIDHSPFTGPANDSKAFFKMGGSAKYVSKSGDCTYTYYANWVSRQGEIGLFDVKNPMQEGFLLISTEKENGFELKGLSFTSIKPSQNSLYNDWACNSGSGTSDKAYDDMALENPGANFQLFNFQFDKDFMIKAGKITGKGFDRSGIEYADGNIPEFGITLEWKAMKPNFPPKPEYAL
ncbi:hypothetical protein GXP67_10100 [Rhodocytophaga rosea]|uniref:Uncharacterized protein n=1 Tax=Rhodocytophaga rosea TaxID=2704465 RepID=A0A6C0GGL7_9BACT|nr:hypothetical protein [Rhodocytophaga rosea]QHT66974.1 hypothetical protein GXP67_10100 [Rhodocytophaga rosea]